MMETFLDFCENKQASVNFDYKKIDEAVRAYCDINGLNKFMANPKNAKYTRKGIVAQFRTTPLREFVKDWFETEDPENYLELDKSRQVLLHWLDQCAKTSDEIKYKKHMTYALLGWEIGPDAYADQLAKREAEILYLQAKAKGDYVIEAVYNSFYPDQRKWMVVSVNGVSMTSFDEFHQDDLKKFGAYGNTNYNNTFVIPAAHFDNFKIWVGL